MDLPYAPSCSMCHRIEAIDDACALEWLSDANDYASSARRALVTRRYVRRLSRAHWFRLALAHDHLRDDLGNYVYTLRVQDTEFEPAKQHRVLFV